MSDWQGSMPHFEHGSLVLRDILIRGDNFAPSQKSAVLRAANFLAYGRLAPNASTTAERLDGQQEVLLRSRRAGRNHSRWQYAKLQKDVAVLMPAGLEFVMKSVAMSRSPCM
jgi:hypothetical protein